MPAVDTQSAFAFCARCGRPETDGNHAACAVGLRLEPPRYCTQCDRRMVVQVTPGGWSARCVEHGTSTGTTGTTGTTEAG